MTPERRKQLKAEAAARKKPAPPPPETPKPADEKPMGWHKRRWNLPERLPNGAAFSVSYDAEKVMWSGTLVIGVQTFHGTNAAVFKLLRNLDRMYREFAGQQDQEGVEKEGQGKTE